MANDPKINAVASEVTSLKVDVKALKNQVAGFQSELVVVKTWVQELQQRRELLVRAIDWFWAERNWSIAVSLTLLGAVGAASWFLSSLLLANLIEAKVDAKLRPLQSSISDLGRDIEGIKSDVSEIKAMFAVLKAQNLTNDLQGASLATVKAKAKEIKEAKAVLAAAPTYQAPDFWPTAFRVITLQSEVQTSIPLPSQLSFETHSTIKDITGGSFERGDPKLLQGHIKNTTFRDCVVIFDEGVILANVSFHNCVFIFPAHSVDSKPIQRIGTQLLASDLSNFSVN